MPNVVLMGTPVSRLEQQKIKLSVFTPAPGSKQVRAQCCGIEVWIGPRQQAALAADPTAAVVCVACTIKYGHNCLGLSHLGGQGGQYTLDNGEQVPPTSN